MSSNNAYFLPPRNQNANSKLFFSFLNARASLFIFFLFFFCSAGSPAFITKNKFNSAIFQKEGKKKIQSASSREKRNENFFFFVPRQ